MKWQKYFEKMEEQTNSFSKFKVDFITESDFNGIISHLKSPTVKRLKGYQIRLNARAHRERAPKDLDIKIENVVATVSIDQRLYLPAIMKVLGTRPQAWGVQSDSVSPLGIRNFDPLPALT